MGTFFQTDDVDKMVDAHTAEVMKEMGISSLSDLHDDGGDESGPAPNVVDDDVLAVDPDSEQARLAEELNARSEALKNFDKDERVVLAKTDPVFKVAPLELVSAADSVLASHKYSSRGRDLDVPLEPPSVYSRSRCLDYLSNEMPMSYSVLRRILKETRAQLPEAIQLDSVLDFGAGTGAASFAAASVCELDRVVAVEPAPYMQELAASLHEASNLLPADTRFLSHLPAEVSERFSVVVAGFVLGELPESQRRNVIDFLWKSTESALVIVEVGSKRGSDAVLDARRQVLERFGDEASVLAPCPHSNECPWTAHFNPLFEGKSKRKLKRRSLERHFCHFGQRVPLPSFPRSSAIHRRRVTASKLRFQNEHLVNFTYSVLVRQPPKPACDRDHLLEQSSSWSRLVKPPLKRGGHVILDLCSAEGAIERKVVSRSNGKGGPYRLARKLQWSDRWPYASA